VRIKTKKVKAFALQEMMVVLVITTVVVGMAFSVLSLVQKQMGTIEGIYEVKLEANKLRQSLWVDFNRYSYAHFDQGKQLLYFSNELGEKQYAITDTQFITEKDTFDIQLTSKLFYFNNQKKTTGEIDAIELKTSKETGYQRIFVFKDNAPATYINQQP
jgi:type II secretory pathway component PulJ